eukprot:365265-Chlamydomonas_euryale.AAC.12
MRALVDVHAAGDGLMANATLRSHGEAAATPTATATAANAAAAAAAAAATGVGSSFCQRCLQIRLRSGVAVGSCAADARCGRSSVVATAAG